MPSASSRLPTLSAWGSTSPTSVSSFTPDIPGSLGKLCPGGGTRRARRPKPARCVLLYSNDDIEKQFSALGPVASRQAADRGNSEVPAAPRAAIQTGGGGRCNTGRDRQGGRRRRLRTGQEYRRYPGKDRCILAGRGDRSSGATRTIVRVFPSSLKCPDDGRSAASGSKPLTPAQAYRTKLLRLVRSLLDSPPDRGISTDELSGESGLAPARLRKALHFLEALGIASNDTAITVFVQSLCRRPPPARRLARGRRLWRPICSTGSGNSRPILSLGEVVEPEYQARFAATSRDAGHATVRTRYRRETHPAGSHGTAGRIRTASAASGSARSIACISRFACSAPWDKLTLTAQLRRRAAAVLLASLTDCCACERPWQGRAGRNHPGDTDLGAGKRS